MTATRVGFRAGPGPVVGLLKVIAPVDPLSPSTLYARPRSDGPPPSADCVLWRSRDRGQTWQCLANPVGVEPQYLQLHDVVTHPGDERIIYGLTSGEGFIRSSDGGASWSPPDGLAFPPGRGTYIRMLVSPSDPDRLYVVAQGNPTDVGSGWFEGLFGSDDRGTNWQLKSTGNPFRATLYADKGRSHHASMTDKDLSARGSVQLAERGLLARHPHRRCRRELHRSRHREHARHRRPVSLGRRAAAGSSAEALRPRGRRGSPPAARALRGTRADPRCPRGRGPRSRRAGRHPRRPR